MVWFHARKNRGLLDAVLSRLWGDKASGGLSQYAEFHEVQEAQGDLVSSMSEGLDRYEERDGEDKGFQRVCRQLFCEL
jgi:hypothetical protein